MESRHAAIEKVATFVITAIAEVPHVSAHEKAELFATLMPRIMMLLTFRGEVKTGFKIGSHYVAMHIIVED